MTVASLIGTVLPYKEMGAQEGHKEMDMLIKTIQKRANVQVTLNDVFVELDKNLDSKEKILVGELKSINKYG